MNDNTKEKQEAPPPPSLGESSDQYRRAQDSSLTSSSRDNLRASTNASSKYYEGPRVKLVHSPEHENSPFIRWVLLGGAFVSTCGLLIYLWGPSQSTEPALSSALPEPNRVSPANAQSQLAPTTRAPLDFTDSLLEAELEAKKWSPSAMLSRISIEVDGEKASGPLMVEYGRVSGPAVPGAYLQSKRLQFKITEDKISRKDLTQVSKRRGLPQPNCPLEVAFRQQQKVKTTADGSLGVFYYFSEKYNRPVWQFKESSGRSLYLDAQNCSLLTR